MKNNNNHQCICDILYNMKLYSNDEHFLNYYYYFLHTA